MNVRTWDDFLAFLYELPTTLNPGRQRIRVVRDSLQALIDRSVLAHLSEDDRDRLFPLGFNPSESDLKIAAGVGLERGLLTPGEYAEALHADKAAGPFGFLQTMSGKAFGETVAPLIAKFWLCTSGDEFIKMRNTLLYDFGVRFHDAERLVRIEMKASSEAHPNFQQIRHPHMTNMAGTEDEYDLLLCLGISNEGLEWWVFPSSDVAQFIGAGVFTTQHGGRKAETGSGTYWIRMDPKNRLRFSDYQVSSESLRDVVHRYTN